MTVCHMAGCFKRDALNAGRAHVGMGHALCRGDDEEDSVILAPYGDKANRVEPVRNISGSACMASGNICVVF